MTKDLSTPVEEKPVEFTTPFNPWHDWIFISSVVTLTFLTLLYTGFKLNALHPFLITAIGFGAYYGSEYFTSTFSTLTVSNGKLSILQNGKRLNWHKELHLPLSLIRGFEIGEVTRGTMALFIYTHTFNYYKYALIKPKEGTLVTQYLSQHIQLLNKKTNPLFPSFITAYLFALKRALLFLLITTTIITGAYLLNIKYHLVLPFSVGFFLFSLLVGISMWWFVIRKPVQRHYFRFGAVYWLSNVFFYLPSLILLPILVNSSRINEKPKVIERSFQLFKENRNSTDLFLIQQATYNPAALLLSDVVIGSSIKGKTFPVTHHFATPLGSGDTIKSNGIYNLWLVQSYRQKVLKSIDYNLKQQEIERFYSQVKTTFIDRFAQKPAFYRLTKDENLTRFISKSGNSSRLNAALEPHWESLADYKKGIAKDTALMAAALFVCCLIACIFIAVNR